MKGHIRKRSKYSWSLVVTLGRDENGKLKQKWFTHRGNKREAENKLSEILSELSKGTYIDPTKQTLSEFIDAWLKYKKPKTSPKTFGRYQQWCEQHIIPKIGDVSIQKLTPKTVDQLYTELRTNGRLDGKGGLSERSVWHCHRILNNILTLAEQWRVIQRNPLFYLSDKPSNTIGNNDIQVLDASQCAGLLKKAKEDSRLYIPIAVAITTGLRRGEILGIKWDDIDFKTNMLNLKRSVYQVKDDIGFKSTKSGKSRKLLLPKFLIDDLKRHKATLSKIQLELGCRFEENLVCPDLLTGGIWKPSAFTGSYRTFMRRIGMGHINFHLLRHTHASLLLAQGENIKLISSRLGHSTTKITLDLYSHLLPESEKSAVENFEKSLNLW